MKRYVDADELKKTIEGITLDLWTESRIVDVIMANIDLQPSADVRENVTAKWIPHMLNKDTPYEQQWGYNCSACGEWFVVGTNIFRYLYCPSCGASMREGGANE